MGYTGINSANAFAGGLMQGISAYSDVRRMKLHEDDIKDRRQRQREQDKTEARKTEAYLRNLNQQHDIARQENERKQFMLRAGDLADKLRGISGITDEKARQGAMDALALSINDDPFLVEYLNLNPQVGAGQGRKVVGFHPLNPQEKNPSKVRYTPLVLNEALKSVGPYTADNTARWPQQAGISFDIESLDRIAGRAPATRKVVSAVPQGGSHPVHMYEDEAVGLMPGADWRYSMGQRAATERAAMRGTGKDPWTQYQDKAAKFFQTHKGIVTGKFYDMQTAWEAQKVAEQSGIELVFNRSVDPETGREGVTLVDHRALDVQAGVVPPQAAQGGEGGRQLNPSEKVPAPTAPGYYTNTDTGNEEYWDGRQFAKVKVNGQWAPVPAQAAGPETGDPATASGRQDADIDKGLAQVKQEAVRTAGWIMEDPSRKNAQMDRIRREYPADVAEAIIEKIEAVLTDYARNRGIVSESAKEKIGKGTRAVRSTAGRTAGAINKAYQGKPQVRQPF